jgi:hypothetical protein
MCCFIQEEGRMDAWGYTADLDFARALMSRSSLAWNFQMRAVFVVASFVIIFRRLRANYNKMRQRVL